MAGSRPSSRRHGVGRAPLARSAPSSLVVGALERRSLPARAAATTRPTTSPTPTASSPAGDLPHGDGRVLHAARLLRSSRGPPTGSRSRLGVGEPHRAAMALNVLFVLGTVLLVWLIARELWPGRERFALGAVGVRRVPAGDGEGRRRCSTRRRSRSSSRRSRSGSAFARSRDPRYAVCARRRARRGAARARVRALDRRRGRDRAARRPALARAR